MEIPPENKKLVVIAGASAGVGRATARRFAEEGARIGLIARDQTRLKATLEEVRQLGGEGIVLSLDVACPISVEKAAEQVEEELGPIELWINNAMTTVYSPFDRLSSEEYRRVTDVTYLGTVWGTMSALKRMKPRNRGMILQVGSALAYRAIPLQSAYCGAKHAIQGFSESLRSELIHEQSDVQVVMVQMPALNTPQFETCRNKMPYRPQPVPPIYQPEVAAEAIYWAWQNAPRELKVGGSTSVVLALNKFFPGMGDFYLGKTGYQGQQTDEADNSNRPDNLFAPVPGDWAARGPFSEQARDASKSLWASTHKGVLTAAGVLLAGVAYVALSRATRDSGGVGDARLLPADTTEPKSSRSALESRSQS